MKSDQIVEVINEVRSFYQAQGNPELVKKYSPFLINKIVELSALSEWRSSSSKWMRRSVAVSLIKPAQEGLQVKAILDFIAPFMNDTEKVVHQGVGWLLREVWKLHPQEVEAFLLEWKDTSPRLIIQYATEKNDGRAKKPL
jgi:3-methyladenine DNA glycosylase AlkD